MANNGNSQALDIFLDILTRVDSNSFDVERCFVQLLNSNPVGCCVALRVFLDKCFDDLVKAQSEIDADTEAEENPFMRGYQLRQKFEAILEKHFIKEVIAGAALAAPFAFAQQLLPWFVRVTTSRSEQEEGSERYASDSFFSYEVYSYYSPRDAYAPNETSFVEALIGAMRHIAKTDPNEFRLIARELSKVNSQSVQAVLARAYVSLPEEYAEDVFEYLMGDERRFDIGDNRFDSTQLFRVAFDYGDAQKREQLEQIILEMKPDWELRHRDLGYSQTLFLKSVTSSLLSPKVYSRLQELERRFPEVKPEPHVGGVTFGAVTSPISSIELDKMSDDDLLNAMRVYDESTDWDVPRSERRQRDFLKGGLVELSREIGEKAKENPERFYNLTKKFDETIPVAYINTIMSGLAASDAPKEWVFETAERFSYRFTGHYRVGFCYSLQKRANDTVPDTLLDIMTQWALTDPDPDPSVPGSSDRLNEWLNRGINSVRGVAVETVANCSLKSDPPRTDRAVKLLSQAVLDPSPAVGACALQSLLQLIDDENERNRALQLCEQVLELHPQLLEDMFTYRFLNWATFHHFGLFGKYIGIMLDSDLEHVRQEGARQATQAALANDGAKELQQRVLAGDAVMRRGAAHTYAAYLRVPKWQNISEKHLRELMYDSDEEVQKQVAFAFTYLRPDHIDGLRGFVFDFLKSPALARETHYLIEYIKPLSTYEHELALEVTESILRALEEKRIVDFWDDDLVSLPLAVYNRSLDETTKNRAIALFERLLRIGIRGAKQALNDWDEHRDWGKLLKTG